MAAFSFRNSTIAVTLIYLALNGLFVFAAPAEIVAGRADVAAATAEHLAGETGQRITQLAVGLALWTSILSMLMASPRVYAKMADDGLMPPALKMKESKPVWATALQIGLAILFVRLSQLESLLGYLGLTLSLSAAATAACLFLPRFQQNRWQKSVTACYVLATVGLGLVFSRSRPQQFLGALATFALGATMYGLTRTAQKKSPLT